MELRSMADIIENRDTSAGSKRPAAEAELATISETEQAKKPRESITGTSTGQETGFQQRRWVIPWATCCRCPVSRKGSRASRSSRTRSSSRIASIRAQESSSDDVSNHAEEEEGLMTHDLEQPNKQEEEQ